MDIILEVTAFAFSVAAFVYGVLHILRKNAPNYFKLYVFAVGCYMLEELWFIVFFFLAKGIYDAIVTVRLFGVFGCLCFMLSSNANEFDKLVDEWNNRKIKILSFSAPLLLVVMYSVFLLLCGDKMSAAEKAVGFLSISPAIFASYFSMKHLLLPGIYVFLWSLLLLIPGIIKSMAYSLSYFIVRDNPDIAVDDCIYLSRKLMKGHKWEMFLLQLGFALLSVLVGGITLGIGLLWMIPYLYCAYARFYERLKEEEWQDASAYEMLQRYHGR